MSSTGRKQAPRLARPAARYWKGKAPKGLEDIQDSDSEEDEEQLEGGDDEEEEFQLRGDIMIKEAGDIGPGDEEDEESGEKREKVGVSLLKGRSMNVALKDVSVSKEGKVIVAGRTESGKTEKEGLEEESEEEESEEEEEEAEKEGSEEESSEYESESEEEAPKPLFRPVFVPKRARVTIAEKEALAEDTEEALRKKEEETEERRKQSHLMVAESIRRELLEKEKEEEVPDVDDVDGLDPAGEFEAWRLRELSRIKQEKEEELRREQEREEIERRRALPEEQRLKEDLERADKTRKEKPKGQQKFLQKYWHKGAFHQDEDILKRHDYTEATESTFDVSLLPKLMQVKNFGKRSRTKYTHLVDQDTTSGNGGFGGTAPVKQGGKGTEAGGCFLCGGPHMKKDCPQNRDKTGANSIATGSRPPQRDYDHRPRDDYRNQDRYRDRDGESHDRNDKHNRNGRYNDRYSRDDGYNRGDRYDGRNDRRDPRERRSYRPTSRSRSPPPSKNRYKARSRERSADGIREKRRRLD